MFNRANTSNLSDEVLTEHLQVVADTFSLGWLEANTGNVIQLLWQRADMLATNELFALAYSIKSLNAIDPKWTREQVKAAKHKDKNNARGAIFELLSLNILHSPIHPVTPAKLNQAGYDGIITHASGKETRVSIKNYGHSTYQRKFEENAAAFEKEFLKLLKEHRYPPCQIILDFPDKYPGEREWKMLYKEYKSWFKEHRLDKQPFMAMVEPVDPSKPTRDANARVIFSLMMAPFKGADLRKFHFGYQSHTFIALAAYHQNEYRNLYSKLEEACANLTKHSAVENDRVENALFIHLPDTVSINQAFEWVVDYFQRYPHKPISSVILYQPAVVQDLATKNTVITNGFKLYFKSNREANPGQVLHYEFTLPTGRVSEESANKTLVADRANGLDPVIPLFDRYVYQHGRHYLRMKPTGDGSFGGNIEHLGSGVHTALIIELPGQPGSVALSGKFAPVDELLIL